MTIPASVTAAIASFVSATQSAAPLASQPRAILQAVQAQGAALLTTIDAAVLGASGQLDGPDPSGMPQVLVNELTALAVSAFDQSALADMRGFVGRAVANLDQL